MLFFSYCWCLLGCNLVRSICVLCPEGCRVERKSFDFRKLTHSFKWNALYLLSLTSLRQDSTFFNRNFISLYIIWLVFYGEWEKWNSGLHDCFSKPSWKYEWLRSRFFGNFQRRITDFQCVKSVRIRSFSCLYCPAIGSKTEIYWVNLRIHSECGEIRTRKTPDTDTFYTVFIVLS